MAQYYIGTSGWQYDHWKGIFYPDKLPKSKWLEFYATYFSTVEVNNSFYRLPSNEIFIKWRTSTPSGFIFTVKVSRYITHIKRLKTADESMKKFIEHVDCLQDKLGPLLYQLPPNMKSDKELLADFPSFLLRHYDHIFEFRNSSWFTDKIFDLLRCYYAGFCVYDMPGITCPLIATNSTGYIRFHGNEALYSSCYTRNEMIVWARRIEAMGKELSKVYLYFNNDARGYALSNATEIVKMLAKQL